MRSRLAEQILREADAVELVRRGLGVPMPVAKREHVVARQQRVPLERRDLVRDAAYRRFESLTFCRMIAPPQKTQSDENMYVRSRPAMRTQ